MMMVVLLMLSACPHEPALVDHVDIMEVNNLYDRAGRLVIRQVIFWDWSPADARHQVVAWRLLKDDQQLPRRDWQRGSYESRWRDMNVYRRVTAGQVRESFTTFDPEVQERSVLPLESRRELTPAGPYGRSQR